MYVTHGLSGHSLYSTWENMRARCRNPSSAMFHRYGGRGIRVCERWDDFATFVSDMGERPPGTSLDRINNDGDYCPENCRWATQAEQKLNTSRNVLWEHNGQNLTISQWAVLVGINKTTLRYRVVRDGWTVAQALSIPPSKRNSVTRRA